MDRAKNLKSMFKARNSNKKLNMRRSFDSFQSLHTPNASWSIGQSEYSGLEESRKDLRKKLHEHMSRPFNITPAVCAADRLIPMRQEPSNQPSLKRGDTKDLRDLTEPDFDMGSSIYVVDQINEK